MAEPKFAIGDIVTRGRGRPTYRVVDNSGSEVRGAGGNVVAGGHKAYGVVNVNDKRDNPRITWIAEHNLRKKDGS